MDFVFVKRSSLGGRRRRKAERLTTPLFSLAPVGGISSRSPDFDFLLRILLQSHSILIFQAMDPSYIDSDEEAAAMAKAMGFSTFGTQGPTKKRKYNPSTDAVVDGQDLASIDRGGKKGQGSGGNQIPIGKPRVFGLSTNGNTDETALDSRDAVVEDTKAGYVDTSLPPPMDEEIEEKHNVPAYLNTSLPPPDKETRETQERIDAILANTDLTPTPPGSRALGNPPTQGLGQSVSRYLTALHSESQQPRLGLAASSGTGRPTVESNRPAQRGQRNELWYVGYYDPSFNENPWMRLEKEKGLQSKGKWLERRGHAV